MIVRKATLKDATGIGKVHVDSWRTTYKHIVPDDYLNNLSYEQRTQLWAQQLADSNKYIVVAENDFGDIIGFASASKRDTNPLPNSNYVETLYLLEEYQGKGIGKQLLKDLFVYFRLKNDQTIFVEVLAENNTKYFYKHFGATLNTSLQVTIGGKVLEELVYEWNDVNKVVALLSIN